MNLARAVRLAGASWLVTDEGYHKQQSGGVALKGESYGG